MTAVTCYVLDADTGAPAFGMAVALRCLSHFHPFSQAQFLPLSGGCHWNLTPFMESVAANTDTAWQVDFNVRHYYKQAKNLWPEVKFCFHIRKTEGYFIALHVGQGSYTVSSRLLPTGLHAPPNDLQLPSQICRGSDVLPRSPRQPYQTRLETRHQPSSIANIPVEPGTFLAAGNDQGFNAHGKTQNPGADIYLPPLASLFSQKSPPARHSTVKEVEGPAQIPERAGNSASFQTLLENTRPSQNLRSWLEENSARGRDAQENQVWSQKLFDENNLQEHHKACRISCEPCNRAKKPCTGGIPCGRCRWTMVKCDYADPSTAATNSFSRARTNEEASADKRNVPAGDHRDGRHDRPNPRLTIPYRGGDHAIVNSNRATKRNRNLQTTKAPTRRFDARPQQNEFVQGNALEHKLLDTKRALAADTMDVDRSKLLDNIVDSKNGDAMAADYVMIPPGGSKGNGRESA